MAIPILGKIRWGHLIFGMREAFKIAPGGAT